MSDLAIKLFNGVINVFDDTPELTYDEAVKMLRERLTVNSLDKVVDAVMDIHRIATGYHYDETCGEDFDLFSHVLRILAPHIDASFGDPHVTVDGCVYEYDLDSFVTSFRVNRVLSWECRDGC
ncbi:hypothetical protein GM415_15485 [Pseudodesulfovibrio cashew]|uniref:Uncharacterized protein n=1 Tax=Pseudodesulfovibrio cashew TaxID=2678688 RepID=A0A6I6JKF2_9BACT|nr:hypothetical protein [Pseudodesulfovibrio cashew]QGY41458.1 hypothetical protein GM415_15485 [Pseudodesulfovibrio cashew]